MLDLPDVTLCSLDCNNIQLTYNALVKCINKVNFGDKILFSGMDTVSLYDIRVQPVNFLGLMGQYSQWCINHWPLYIKTKFALMIHWDGYILDENSWKNEFLEYDYIGAPWYWRDEHECVGNGGFSLRSKKLMDACVDLSYSYDGSVPEDEMIGKHWRPILESKYGCKFPGRQLAQKFSYERTQPNEPTFGFHGFFNLWRHTEDQTMIDMAKLFPDYVVKKSEYNELVNSYAELKKFAVLKALTERQRQVKSTT